MASNTSAVVVAVKTAVASASGMTDRVVVGFPPAGKPAATPWGYVYVDQVSSDVSAELGGYVRTATIGVCLYLGATSDTPEARTLAAYDLADLVAEALQADRTLGGLVMDVLVESTALDGDTFGLGGVAVVGASVRVYWLVTGGVGL